MTMVMMMVHPLPLLCFYSLSLSPPQSECRVLYEFFPLDFSLSCLSHRILEHARIR